MGALTADRLQSTCDWIQALDFDTPFGLTPSGIPYRVEAAPYHGTVYHDDETDVALEVNDWVPMTGLTNQHGYRGACLHASEQMSPGVVLAMVETGSTLFVLTPVEVLPDDEDPDPFPAGWTILRHVTP